MFQYFYLIANRTYNLQDLQEHKNCFRFITAHMKILMPFLTLSSWMTKYCVLPSEKKCARTGKYTIRLTTVFVMKS